MKIHFQKFLLNEIQKILGQGKPGNQKKVRKFFWSGKIQGLKRMSHY